MFEEEKNGFKKFRGQLMTAMACNPRFFQTSLTGTLECHRAAILEWFATLNKIVEGLYYLIICTCGGGVRGTEFSHLLYRNEPGHRRHLFIVNGSVTIITEYTKTTSVAGVGKTVARTPSPEVGGLCLLVFGVIFHVAGHIGNHAGILQASMAERYLSEMFIKDGNQVNSDKLSKVVGSYTANAFGFELRQADFRQLMTALQVAFVGTNVLDAEDEENTSTNIVTLHKLFARTVAVDRAAYAIDDRTAETRLSFDLFAEMQRVSFLWHEVIGQLHQELEKQNIHRDSEDLPTEEAAKHLKMVIKGNFDRLSQRFDELFKTWAGKLREGVHTDLQGVRANVVERLKLRLQERMASSMGKTGDNLK
ncbi:hypothetical protein PQX77_002449 [Marasmius sp. AFHP31]|nr:hypothetical protein PQX77_002449 [Marasmius sp. AFHP31]